MYVHLNKTTMSISSSFRNPYLSSLETDHLYHLGLHTGMKLREIFGDTRFVCMGGSPDRAAGFARLVAKELDIRFPGGYIRPLGKTERFVLFKVGPVISASHGMGMPSTLILLHELTKLLDYAGCEDPIYLRIGTSGGVGVEPGTVVVSSGTVNGELEPWFDLVELGNRRRYPTQVDNRLTHQLLACAHDLPVTSGLTMGTDDFYEGQGRLDGALEPGYTDDDKLTFLQKAYKAGVRNIEMESTAIAAFCNRANIRAGILCTALLNRLKGDQIESTPDELQEYSLRAARTGLEFIRRSL